MSELIKCHLIISKGGKNKNIDFGMAYFKKLFKLKIKVYRY